MSVLVEGCVDSVETAVAAQRGGAMRLELCANLAVGGTTPSPALIREVQSRVRLPMAMMISPRGGSYVHTAAELQQMMRDMEMARSFGADAFVIGVLEEDGGPVNAAQTRALVAAARGTPVVFHRAFDDTPDLEAALDTLIDAGVARVLTSGGAATAEAGSAMLAELVDRSKGRITIMAGGKVRGRNVREIVETSGVTEVHARSESDERQIKAIVDALYIAR